MNSEKFNNLLKELISVLEKKSVNRKKLLNSLPNDTIYLLSSKYIAKILDDEFQDISIISVRDINKLLLLDFDEDNIVIDNKLILLILKKLLYLFEENKGD